jgi:hypothetical protein
MGTVKEINYQVGQKVYFSEGVEEKYFRGTITKNLKIAVRLVNPKGIEEKICKRNLGIVV